MNFKKPELKYAIIEDAPDVCVGLEERMAEYTDWQHCGTRNEIESAIDLIEKEKPCLIFMDWNIKGGSTYELLDLIKLDSNFNPYIIYFTAFQGDEPSIPVRVNNIYKVDKYLVKPFWVDFTECLSVFLEEAEAKNNVQSDATFLKDVYGTMHQIRCKELVHIHRHHENNRVKILTFINGSIIAIKGTFEEMEQLLQLHQIDYFFTNKRYSIVCRNFIKSYDAHFVYFENNITKTEIVAERFRLFEEWILNNSINKV
jgi:CheY-like chemotaxis protein